MGSRFSDWFSGYVLVRFQGDRLEALINASADAGARLRNVERIRPDMMVAIVRVQDVRTIRPAVRSTRTHLSVIQKRGFPFFFAKLRRRPGLWLGFFFILLLIAYASSFVWFVRVEGNQATEEEAVHQLLAAAGVRPGMPKRLFSAGEVEQELIWNLSQVIWAQAELEGVRLVVRLRERQMPEAELKTSDLVAARPALITLMIPFSGIPLVAVGDTVESGQPLIAVGPEGKAEGLVKGKVWYEAVGEASTQPLHAQFTGRTAVGYSVQLGSYVMHWRQAPDFSQYKVATSLRQVRLFQSNIAFGLERTEYSEVRYVPVPISLEEAETQALQRAWDVLADEGVNVKEADVVELQVMAVADDLGIRVQLVVEVEEPIGKYVQ